MLASSQQCQTQQLNDITVSCRINCLNVFIIFSMSLYDYYVCLPEPGHVQRGKSPSAVVVSSPVQSDDEYLSPQEEKMEVGDSPSLNKGISSREPPSFQVRICIKVNQPKSFQFVVGCRAQRVGGRKGFSWASSCNPDLHHQLRISDAEVLRTSLASRVMEMSFCRDESCLCLAFPMDESGVWQSSEEQSCPDCIVSHIKFGEGGGGCESFSGHSG